VCQIVYHFDDSFSNIFCGIWNVCASLNTNKTSEVEAAWLVGLPYNGDCRIADPTTGERLALLLGFGPHNIHILTNFAIRGSTLLHKKSLLS